MPIYEGQHETDLPVSPDAAFDTLTDFEHLAEWQGPLKRCRVLSRYENGLGEEVEYEIDAVVRKIRYVLRHTYERPAEIGSEYLRGDFKTFEGRWYLDPRGEHGTRARLEMRIDPGVRLPGPVASMIRQRVLKSAVEDLRKRLERG